MRHFVESRMNLCLILGCIIGLVWPYWDAIPNQTAIALVMGATLIACFRLNMQELKQTPWKLTGMFYVLRYVIIPALVFFAGRILFEEQIALGLMLIASLPVGASAPAMTHVFGGHVVLTAIFTMLTTLLAPIVMPLLFTLVYTNATQPPIDMFLTLLISLIFPCLIFLYVRRFPVCHYVARDYGKMATILMISLMIAIVVGKQRHLVFDHPVMVVQLIILTFALLSFLLWFGWIGSRKLPRDQRIALATASGFNNIGLGVGIALLHFSPMVILVAIATEIAWAFLPVVMRFISSSEA